MGMQLVLTSKPDAKAGPGVLPISYAHLPDMAEVGDTIFLGRYLVTGSEDSSVYLTVRSFHDPKDGCLPWAGLFPVCPEALEDPL